MCVVALALNAHPQWRVVLAANRDEFHSRPSAPVARWDGTDNHIIAGRDLQSGGTWLGVSESGRLAVVTNIRTGSPPDPEKASRGDLVADYLRNAILPRRDELDGYNPFSLLTIGPDDATLCANRPAPLMMPLAHGIHGLSNGAPYESWPRKEKLLEAFTDCLEHGDHHVEALLDMLAGEDMNDSIFIRNPVYGTRCSTVVAVDEVGNGMIIERRFGPSGIASGHLSIAFNFESQ